MINHHVIPILTLAVFTLSGFGHSQQHTSTLVSPHGTVHVYEVPRRDRNDYQPTYEEAARRKAEGYSLNSREKNVLRSGGGYVKPGSIEEAVLLKRQQSVLKNQVDSDVERMDAGTTLDIKRSKAVIETETDADIQRMKALHELKLKQARKEMELELEYERKKRELELDKPAQSQKARPLLIEVEDTATSAAT